MHARESAGHRVIRSLCTKVGSCFALKVRILLDAGDFNQLANLEMRSEEYSDASSFANDYLIYSFLSKWKGLETGIDTRKRAVDGWIAAEEKCRMTNLVFRRTLRGLSPRVETVILAARRKIANVLGELNHAHIFSECKWSNGATFDLRRGSTFAQKMSEKLSVTKPAFKYLRACIESDPHWFAAITGILPSGPFCLYGPATVNLVRGSRFLTVPKNAKTDRCISAEPTGNAFLQQGVHTYISKRLRRYGIDLRDQSHNQRAASLAQKLGYATIDLKSASDTICRSLIAELLPVDWYLFLDDLRSHESRVDGEWIRLEKFSSMGNAFTFELETLIFWALMGSLEELEHCESRKNMCLVYGDDIIINSANYSYAVEVLESCGFTVNPEKSFFQGRFYESCGSHYFDGFNVTPVYQKELLDTREELIRCYNRLVRWSNRLYGFSSVRYILGSLDILMACFKGYHDTRIPRIPEGSTDDDGFLSSADLLGHFDVHSGYKCVVYTRNQKYQRVDGSCFFAYKLRRPTTSSSDKEGRGQLGGEGKYRFNVSYRYPWNTVAPQGAQY